MKSSIRGAGASAAPAREPLPALTGLRFWAALHVLLYHYVALSGARYPAGPVGGAMSAVTGSGYLGVGLFFVLSGFILTYNYLPADRHAVVARRVFWRARAARIYPVYLLSLFVSAPMLWAWASHKLYTEPLPGAAAKIALVVSLNVLMLQAWLPHAVAPWNTPGWSLSVEAFFYALFPFVAPWLVARSGHRLAAAAAALWVGALATPAAYLALASAPQLHQGDPPAAGMTLTAIKYFPVFHLPEFLLGVLAGHAFVRRRALTGVRDRPDPRWGTVADFTSLTLVALLLATPRMPYPLLHDGLLAPLFALLVFGIAAGDGRVSRLLSGRRAVLLGGASYAMYLLHVPLLAYVDRAAAGSGLVWSSPWWRALVSALAAIGVSVAVLLQFEEPARRWLRAAFGAPRRPLYQPLRGGDVRSLAGGAWSASGAAAGAPRESSGARSDGYRD